MAKQNIPEKDKNCPITLCCTLPCTLTRNYKKKTFIPNGNFLINKRCCQPTSNYMLYKGNYCKTQKGK